MIEFQVRQEKFEGSLSALLDLIEKEKLAITEVSLARAADEFLTYVRALPVADQEEIAEFLVIASQLLLIKSRSLLPDAAFADEEQASGEELARRLAALQKIREAARAMAACERLGLRIAGREAYFGMEPVFLPGRSLTPGVLAAACAEALSRIPRSEKLAEEKLQRIVTLEEKIGHIRRILEDAVERSFSEMLAGTKEKTEIIVSFLALLELARQKFIFLRQDRPFDDIRIQKVS